MLCRNPNLQKERLRKYGEETIYQFTFYKALCHAYGMKECIYAKISIMSVEKSTFRIKAG